MSVLCDKNLIYIRNAFDYSEKKATSFFNLQTQRKGHFIFAITKMQLAHRVSMFEIYVNLNQCCCGKVILL